jgi:hypothetical protein
VDYFHQQIGMSVKANEVEGYTIPTAISTFRTEVRAVSNQQEAQIKCLYNCRTIKSIVTNTQTQAQKNPQSIQNY